LRAYFYLSIVDLTLKLALAVAIWQLATPPSRPFPNSPDRARKIIRTSIIIVALCTAIIELRQLFFLFQPRNHRILMDPFQELRGYAVIAYLTFSITAFLALFVYARQLALRIPSAPLARTATKLCWLLGIAFIIHQSIVAALTLGPQYTFYTPNSRPTIFDELIVIFEVSTILQFLSAIPILYFLAILRRHYKAAAQLAHPLP
jgi:hypothetical protein